MAKKIETIKTQILTALAHPEAEEGLFLHNLKELHEEDERPAVTGSDEDVMEAIELLVEEHKVHIDRSGEKMVVRLA